MWIQTDKPAGIKNSVFETMNVFEFENNSGTWLNIQMNRPDHDISWINPESQINPESRVKPESWSDPDSWINFDSQINYLIQTNSLIRPTFNNPLTQQTENTPPTRPTEIILKISKWLDQTKMSVKSILEVESTLWVDSFLRDDSILIVKSNLESRINCPTQINSPIWPTFNIPLTQSAGRRILRQRDNFYVVYNFYVEPNLQSRGEII